MVSAAEVLKIDASRTKAIILDFLRRLIDESGSDGYVLGLSGGVDSSVVAKLCVEAVGRKKVLGLLMPSETTPQNDVLDAERIASMLGIEYEVVDITTISHSLANICKHGSQASILAKGNIKPRVRMTVLYYHANILNRLVAGTGNRSELLIGYYTKYGDGGVDCLPIGNLYKTQVRQLAEHLGIPSNIIWKTPTAGLWKGQTDEDEIGLKYEQLDLLLYYLCDLGMDVEAASKLLNLRTEITKNILMRIKNSEHKRRPIPMPPIPATLSRK
ncbi:MAG: NAD+ synthase [Nitrososphaerota archaeon]|nr:NAD+ synthase [Aigarchaeota archaeon]MDW8076143.1 NAD+ synthase [Nitrososphaerota archaeon]